MFLVICDVWGIIVPSEVGQEACPGKESLAFSALTLGEHNVKFRYDFYPRELPSQRKEFLVHCSFPTRLLQ